MAEEKEIPKQTKEVEVKDGLTGKIEKEVLPNWRTIEIQIDGNSIKVTKAEVAGRLEMLSVLRELIKVYESK